MVIPDNSIVYPKNLILSSLSEDAENDNPMSLDTTPGTSEEKTERSFNQR